MAGKHLKNSVFHRKTPYRKSRLAARLTTVLAIASTALAASFSSTHTSAATVFINEIHYDNAGSDVNEGIEIAGLGGTDLNGWSLIFYNGLDGSIYRTESLSGIIDNESTGFGALSFSFSGIQNGPADGFALIDNLGALEEFISYEGSVTASEGIASGLSSTDIGVSETNTQAAGLSLQRIGSGQLNGDFSWMLQVNSFGDINTGQTFTSAVPVPASAWLFISGLSTLFARKIYASSD